MHISNLNVIHGCLYKDITGVFGFAFVVVVGIFICLFGMVFVFVVR